MDLIWFWGLEGALFLEIGVAVLDEDELGVKRMRGCLLCGTYYPEVFGSMEHGCSHCWC